MLFIDKEDNLFKKGIFLYKDINEILEEIFNDLKKEDNLKKTKLKNCFNYLVQSFLFDLSIPEKEDKLFSFLELLYIVDIGNLNLRLDFAVEKKTNLVFLMLAEKKKDDVKDFCKEINKHVFDSRKFILKIFDEFNNLKKNKDAVYDKIIETLAMIIENFLKLEGRMENKVFLLKIVKKTKKFFFNM